MADRNIVLASLKYSAGPEIGRQVAAQVGGREIGEVVQSSTFFLAAGDLEWDAILCNTS